MPWATGVVVWIIHPTVSTKCSGKGRVSVKQRGAPRCNTASKVQPVKDAVQWEEKEKTQPPLSWPGFPEKEHLFESLYTNTQHRKIKENRESDRERGNLCIRQYITEHACSFTRAHHWLLVPKAQISDGLCGTTMTYDIPSVEVMERHSPASFSPFLAFSLL